MGNGVSTFIPCIRPPVNEPALVLEEPLDENLGHSFCYVRSNRFSQSDRFGPISPSGSYRFSPSRRPEPEPERSSGFRSISGASLSANTSTAQSVDCGPMAHGCFESSSLFSALPLQPVPRGGEGFFMSGPLERGAVSGPIDPKLENGGRVPFSAPLVVPEEKKGGKMKKKKDPWVVPVLNFKKGKMAEKKVEEEEESQIQWALGKAGEDRVHVVVSEEQGWLFVGIYDGFNGPDAPEFLMRNLYKCVHAHLEGLFWELDDGSMRGHASKRVRKQLWELMAEESEFDLSGSGRFAFTVNDAIGSSSSSRRWMLSKVKQGLRSKSLREGGEKEVEKREENRVKRRGKVGPVDQELVLRALEKGLESTESAYLEMTDRMLDVNPELALMGACLLVVLMREDDVYVMNVGDSRAIVAQSRCSASIEGTSHPTVSLSPLQLSTDHSTSVEEEIARIRSEHPDDDHCIVNDRIKGRLKVTRAFGAGFLKRPKFNDAVLEMFRNEYIGDSPYLSCEPHLRHHKLLPRDQFLVLSSDGLYQFLTNEEVILEVANFLRGYPDGDPAQHLIEEVLSRAAKKAGMDFHELLEIPTGDRRKYHDDVTVMVVSLEGRIWKSSWR